MSVTRELASWLITVRPEEIPADVVHEARRAVLNYVGCALGGSRDEAVEIAMRALAPFSGPQLSRVLGRSERRDPLQAALLNGIASHVLDYDDTTPHNYIHPSAPVASALFAFAAANSVSGADLLHAFILGFEAESRVGNATYPAHYSAGWHSTGSVGVFGAAAAIGRLIKLDRQRMIWTLGLAATQASGLREMFGSMGKAFHPGRAAQSGYMAATLAEAGFTSGEQGIEGPRGFAFVTAAERDLDKITQGMGVDFELRSNTYKPFPCGIVIHPTIDGCIQLHREHGIAPDEIEAVELRVAPLVLDLCNKKKIAVGLEGKFSVYHAAAIGLVRGRGGINEFTDAAVNDPPIKRVRELAEAKGDPAIAEDAVEITVTLAGGRRIGKRVEHAIGNLERPLSDRELEEKFVEQGAVALSRAALERLTKLCWSLDKLSDCRQLVEATAPG